MLVLLPTIIWTFLKYKLNIVSSSTLIHGELMFEFIYNRFVNEFYKIIYHFLIFSNLIYPLLFVLLVILLLKYNKIIINNYVWIPVKISIIYFSILVVIIMINELNINNLYQSIRRVTMPIMMILYIFSFMVLKELKIYDKLIKHSR